MELQGKELEEWKKDYHNFNKYVLSTRTICNGYHRVR